MKPSFSIRKPEYGGGLGIHWFRNPYGGRGISISLILIYVSIHWVVRRDGIDYDEDDQ